MDQKKIGKFIALCRKENGYTQAALAEKLGITDRAVSKWENGKSMPDASIMLELCELLKINVDELLTGEHILVDNLKGMEVSDKNMVSEDKKTKLTKRRFLALTIFVVMILLACFAVVSIGDDLGGDLGEFIYNITH